MGISGRFPQEKPAATESRYPTLINYQVHAGSIRVPVIHRTLTWTTGSSTCVRDHSYACVCCLSAITQLTKRSVVSELIVEFSGHSGITDSLWSLQTRPHAYSCGKKSMSCCVVGPTIYKKIYISYVNSIFLSFLLLLLIVFVLL